MLPKINPTKTLAWKKLLKLYKASHALNLHDLFKTDKNRFEKFSIEFNELSFDYSKNIVTKEVLESLHDLARECQLTDAITAMFEGKHINETEDRAVLHTALRSFSKDELIVNEEDVISKIQNERERMKFLCEKIHSKNWTGYSGKPIRNIVNIGIGGSDLGASMVTGALRPYWKKGMKPFFISNVDGSNLCEVMEELELEETLFIIASKTFTTQETMTNAQTVRKIFLEHCTNESFIEKHFIAVTGNKQGANEFGIPNENIFEIWDWICGRFSLWGSMGVSIALTIGYSDFEELLKGANEVDNHFRTVAFEKNIPVIMALLSIWYINFFNVQSEAVLPYDHYLDKFKSYLQQGAMESNGKSIDRNGLPANYQTGVVIWGEKGTNGQHSFHQLLHQGKQLIPCDFIIPVNNQNDYKNHHEKLMCNALAQTEALMKGKTKQEVESQIKNKDHKVNNYKTFEGNKPTNTILIKKLTPHNLGSLIAFYEHKIFVQGVIWNIFSFDQWGVELGKELSLDKLTAIQTKTHSIYFDSSTNGLLNKIKEWTT